MSAKRSAVLAATAAAFCAGAVVAVAADEPKTIVACVTTSDGSPRIVDSASQCIAGRETGLSWNGAGVPGPSGPQGSQGPQGPAGAAGTTAVLSDADAGGEFDPAGLTTGDLKAYKADAKTIEKVAGQRVVTGKRKAVATCDLVEDDPVVPGQCVIRVKVTDYLSCPSSHPLAVDHNVAPFPAKYTPGEDHGRGVPFQPPFAGYAFSQTYPRDPLLGTIASGQAIAAPSTTSVKYKPTKPNPGGVGGAVQAAIDANSPFTLTAHVRGPGYKPVEQVFGVREYLTCEVRSTRKRAKSGRP